MHFLNSNKAPEMAQIMEDLQKNYVPVNVVNEQQQRILFDGDQLTEERGRNAQWANTLAGGSVEQLDGLITSFGDWHLKKNILEVQYVCSCYL